jgi:hypothetical protein
MITESSYVDFALIAGGVLVALYLVNQSGTAVGSGIASGAEFAGAGIGLAAIVGVILLAA